jgi:hypothetical protein
MAEADVDTTPSLLRFVHRTRTPLRHGVFPHGPPSEDCLAVYKERVTVFTVPGINLNPAEWRDPTIRVCRRDEHFSLAGKRNGRPALHFYVEFSDATPAEVRLPARRPAVVTSDGTLSIALAVWGASSPDMVMTLRLTSRDRHPVAACSFVVRAKLTTKSARARTRAARMRDQRAAASDICSNADMQLCEAPVSALDYLTLDDDLMPIGP